ncbi:MAG: hypothetical protein LBF27_06990 [Sphingobacterium sp.]|jgi:hypothetical protein|nr:hypothetical protein [Sphingobacterium sp.]
MINSSKFKFYLMLLGELILAPWKYIENEIRWNYGSSSSRENVKKQRIPVLNNRLAVCIHEWGGYEEKRKKRIININEFECGLYYQLLRFRNYAGSREIDVTLTVSESFLMQKKVENIKIMNVSNVGMDFSGYEQFYESIKDEANQYVILTNTSVNKKQVDFIDDYLDYFEQNASIGLLGVSVSSKIYQSLIRNNFNPHLQSFFLLTTTNVLKEIVEKNNRFPGKGITDKSMLIRMGEVQLSRVAMELGYQLACILEDGTPFLFDKAHFKDNGHNSWTIPFGDYRLSVKNPNAINPISREYRPRISG